MSKPSRGLGRGFDSLIPEGVVDAEFDVTQNQGAEGESILQIPVDSLEPNPHQPRQFFDEEALKQLAESIKVHGILQPLVVSQIGAGKFQLIAGERRWRAAKMAAEETVPAVVRSFSEQQKLELALLENLQREELNAIETATAYKKLVDEFNMTPEEIGAKLGRHYTTVVNTMRILTLPLEAKRAVATGRISESMGRTILMVEGTEKQLAFLDLILKNGWNVRKAEAFARDFKGEKGNKSKGLKRLAQTTSLTRDLTDHLGTKVRIQNTAKGGRLLIEYYSDEELERIYNAIKGTGS